jgi:hypothetical protein
LKSALSDQFDFTNGIGDIAMEQNMIIFEDRGGHLLILEERI